MNKKMTICALTAFLLSCSPHIRSSNDQNPANFKAKNDQIHTQSGSKTNIDVLTNDSYETSLPIISSYTQPKHGTLIIKNNRFIYQADKKYSGNDYFFYQIKNSEGITTNAHVKIIIAPIIVKTSVETSLPVAHKNPQKKEKLAAPTSNQQLPKASKVTLNPTNRTEPQTTPLAQPQVSSDQILNPYYKRAAWKLWYQDQSTVDGHRAVSTFQRVFPIQPLPGNDLFLSYSINGNKQYYAGFWDDFYLNQDSNHSRLKNGWTDDHGNFVKNLKKKINSAITGTFDSSKLKKWGVTFTSQSTTQMGHDIANRLSRMKETEVLYYFSNVLRAGPAHISFTDSSPDATKDNFEALSPIMLNSYGKSGGEMNAITKLLLAGGYLPKTTKQTLKLHGLYPSTLLYLWKAGLPYKVPYDNELRHRSAYMTKPMINQHKKKHNGLIHVKYDEVQHLKNMIEIAKNMTVAAPIALLKKINIEGGKVIYDQLKTTWLIHQNKETVTLEVSTADSYDLQKLPLTDNWKVLYGNKNTTIKQLGPHRYKITVPYDPNLPKGRTSILFSVNNGRYDSNPAIINVYRNKGKKNKRPTLEGLYDTSAKPGETVEFNIESTDPEGFPTTLYQWDNEVGNLSGDHFKWTIPINMEPGKYPVTVISSDGTTGSSYEGKQVFISIKAQ